MDSGARGGIPARRSGISEAGLLALTGSERGPTALLENLQHRTRFCEHLRLSSEPYALFCARHSP